MRLCKSAAGLRLLPVGLWLVSASLVNQAAAQSAPTRTAPSGPASASAPADGGTAKNDTSGMDAAARHARRVACLKEARAKKKVGAARNSFVKNCVAGQ